MVNAVGAEATFGSGAEIEAEAEEVAWVEEGAFEPEVEEAESIDGVFWSDPWVEHAEADADAVADGGGAWVGVEESVDRSMSIRTARDDKGVGGTTANTITSHIKHARIRFAWYCLELGYFKNWINVCSIDRFSVSFLLERW